MLKKTQNRNNEVYRLIKNRILSLEYTPGQQIDLRQIKNETGFSLSPINSAIGRLFGEGFIKIEPRKGTFVSEISINEIQSLMDYRMILERGAIPFVIEKITSHEISKLRSIHRKMITLESNEYWKYMELNSQFHSIIIQSAKNTKLTESYSLLAPHFNMIRFHNFFQRGKYKIRSSEHDAIVESLEKRDLLKADKAIKTHLLITEKEFCDSNFKNIPTPLKNIIKL